MTQRSTPDGQEGPPADAPRRELDVRPLLASGREPLSAIMDAVGDLEVGEVLALRAPFNPRPLHAVMRRRGYRHAVRKRAPRDVEVLYWRDSVMPGPRSTEVGSEQPPEVVAVIDVRGLKAPEPMMQTLAALDELPIGAALLQINERVPAFLLPHLEERGFAYSVADDSDGYRMTIWRRSDSG